MEYITGIPALNVLCSLETPGDWHAPSVDWPSIQLYDSDMMFFKNYGIERNKTIPENTKKFNVANHIRAILDLLELDNFAYLKGMRNNFIETDKYDDEIFNKVYSMKVLPHWKRIDDFMEKEYMLKWIFYKQYIENRMLNKNSNHKEDTNWQIKHKSVMSDFLKYLNSSSTDYILKGGTGLMFCYGLNRFSENIDLDGVNKNKIKKIIDSFCTRNNYPYRIAKDTDTTKRFFIHYGNIGHPLKIEVSFRSLIKNSDYIRKNDILIYPINELMTYKLDAYNSRDTLRDLYDIVFIAKNYWNDLETITHRRIENALSYKGLEHFNYILYTTKDKLMDKDKLTTDFLELLNKLQIKSKELDEPELER